MSNLNSRPQAGLLAQMVIILLTLHPQAGFAWRPDSVVVRGRVLSKCQEGTPNYMLSIEPWTTGSQFVDVDCDSIFASLSTTLTVTAHGLALHGLARTEATRPIDGRNVPGCPGCAVAAVTDDGIGVLMVSFRPVPEPGDSPNVRILATWSATVIDSLRPNNSRIHLRVRDDGDRIFWNRFVSATNSPSMGDNVLVGVTDAADHINVCGNAVPVKSELRENAIEYLPPAANTSELDFVISLVDAQNPQGPVCNAGGPYSGAIWSPVQFDGTASSDPNGTIVSYLWSFGDGATGSGATPTHTYLCRPPAGTYTANLCVRDDTGLTSCCSAIVGLTGDPTSENLMTPTPGFSAGCCGGGDCPPPPYYQEKSDRQGNKFILSCEGAYFCLRYDPVIGPTVMVSKCPWWGGLNGVALHGIPSANPMMPERWVMSDHTSYDFDPFTSLPQSDYCDDLPPSGPSDGLYDWVTQHYDVCSNRLTVLHWTSSDGVGDGDVVPGDALDVEQIEHRYVNPPPAAPCNFSAFFPTAVNGSCAPGAPPAFIVPPMRMVSTRLAMAGTPQGGEVVLSVDARSVLVTTQQGQTIEEVAILLADAVNGSAEFSSAGVAASVEGSTLVLSAGRQRVSMSSKDAGIAQPEAPENFHYVVRDSVADLFWTNGDSYDVLQLTRAGRPLAINLTGTDEAYTDTTRWIWPRDYTLIGWKNGMPSAGALAATVSVMDDGAPGSVAGLQVTTGPNPFSRGLTLRFGLDDSGRVSLDVYDLSGRLVRRLSVRRSVGAGEHEIAWDGRDDRGHELPSGIYVYRLESGSRVATGKMVLLR